MHPVTIEQLVGLHRADLHRAAELHRFAAAARPSRPATRRAERVLGRLLWRRGTPG